MSCHYIDVLLPVPLEGLFTYSVPPELEASAERGRRVLVPFGRNKTYVGLVVRKHEDKPQFAVKDVKLVLDDARIVTDGQLELWRWISTYYMAAPGDVLSAALPGGLKSVDAYRPKTETCLALHGLLQPGIWLFTVQKAAFCAAVYHLSARLWHPFHAHYACRGA